MIDSHSAPSVRNWDNFIDVQGDYDTPSGLSCGARFCSRCAGAFARIIALRASPWPALHTAALRALLGETSQSQ